MTDAEPDEDDERHESEHRNFVNLAAVIAILVLAICAFWLLRTLDEKRKLEACLESGRRNCEQVLQ